MEGYFPDNDADFLPLLPLPFGGQEGVKGGQCDYRRCQTPGEGLMPLGAGDRLGPYEIVAPLGAGGMGEVSQQFHLVLNWSEELKGPVPTD